MIFQNRCALVTGAAGNIGQGVCRKFIEQGVKVAVADMDEGKVNSFVEELEKMGGSAIGVTLDISSSESCRKAVEKVMEAFGKIDILVNNAGIWKPGGATFQIPEEDWVKIVDINLNGTYRMIREVVPSMVKNQYGRVVNLASIAGIAGLPGYCHYAAAKAGVMMLTKTLAMEVAKAKVTVNSVSPGIVSIVPGVLKEVAGNWIGREGDRDEMAEAILFLAADDNGFITGVDIPVDGGRTLGPHNASFTLQ